MMQGLYILLLIRIITKTTTTTKKDRTTKAFKEFILSETLLSLIDN